jgi:putative hemolysin
MLELGIVLILILLNGLFALSELAIVSARSTKLKVLAESGRTGALQALALAEDQGRFLSTVQVGITLIGIVTGTYSGAAFGEKASNFLLGLGVPVSIAEVLGIGSVVVLITYLSVIIGELVPKNLALRNPEVLASVVAPLMTLLYRLAGPAVWLLESTTALIFKLFGETTDSPGGMTEEEIKTIIAEAESAGVLAAGEHRLISGVLRLPDRPARTVMTPRADVDWLDMSGSEEQIKDRLITTVHSLLPVGRGPFDRIVGVVPTQRLLAAMLLGKPLDVEAVLCQAPAVPENVDTLDILDILRAKRMFRWRWCMMSMASSRGYYAR